MKKIFLSVLVLFAFAGTLAAQDKTSVQEEFPVWVQDMITLYQEEPVTNPPRCIWRSKYKGYFVYYVPSPCCGKSDPLYDAHGDLICYPSGGFTGKGNRAIKCPDFSLEHPSRERIWQDTRTAGETTGEVS